MSSIERNIFSIEQATSLFLQNKSKIESHANTDNNISFGEIFNQKSLEVSDIKFSKHANQRLQSRNIVLSDEQLGRLNSGVDQARNKSINDSLVMVDDLAFIVNVKNNTVVTALEKNEDVNVFTNIDGAVIV